MPEEKEQNIPSETEQIQTEIVVKKSKNMHSQKEDFRLIPQKYKKQEIVKNDEGKPKLEIDEATGTITKTLKLTDPLIPEGKEIDPLYKEQYNKVSTLAGKRVKYVILGADQKTIINDEIDCARLDRA